MSHSDQNTDEEPIQPEAAEISENYEEKWKRALADAENQRRRHELERSTLSKFSQQAIIEDLLPVVDNFYRATEHIPAEQQNSAWVTGIQYIQKNLLDVLEGHGVVEIPVKSGDHLDLTKHEVIGTVEVAGKPEDTVIEVKNRGYSLHDRVLRPAQVLINKPTQSKKSVKN